MADSAVLDPTPPFISDPFDPINLPSDLPFDPHHHPDVFSDLYFDGDLEFSIDDLIDFPDPDDDVKDGSGVSSTSPGRRSPVNSSEFAAFSPDSGNSATAGGEERGDGRKRKESGDGNRNPSPIAKLRRSDEADSSCLLSEDDEKRKARLMRNRESAQLSRQRKKHYVEELEEKVRSMHSTISDLNGRIAFIMAENARLRQQLGSGVGKSAGPAVYPVMPPMAPLPFPWVPCAVRPPGAQVPLVPIPRLKPHTCGSSVKPKRAEGKKGESKVKKVASVSFLGLFMFMLVIGGFDFGYRSLRNDGLNTGKRNSGRVLTVSGNFDRLNETVRRGVCDGNGGCGKGSGGHRQSKRFERRDDGGDAKLKKGHETVPNNASEPLLASLYIPRNDKLVKIDGNLIISSVLASERAMARTKAKEKGYKMDPVAVEGRREVDLADKGIVPGRISSALAVGNSGSEIGMVAGAYIKAARNHKALPVGSGDVYIENSKSAQVDGHLQDWFREGLEGPIFSSGMCTEVFQFDALQDAGNGGSIVPATSIKNATTNLTESVPCTTKLKNRRILYPESMTLNNSTINNTEGRNFSRSQQDRGPQNTTTGKSMVVSVLIDPREVGDASDIDGMVSPKTISRIFVVVLVDGVKYVTYSCMLPFKSTQQHLVTV